MSQIHQFACCIDNMKASKFLIKTNMVLESGFLILSIISSVSAYLLLCKYHSNFLSSFSILNGQ